MVEPPVDTAAVGMLPPFCVVKIWPAAFATSCKQLHVWLELCVDYAWHESVQCWDYVNVLSRLTSALGCENSPIVSHVFVSMPLLGEPTPYRVSFSPRIERASGERMGLWSFRCPVWSGVILWFSLVMDQNGSKHIKRHQKYTCWDLLYTLQGQRSYYIVLHPFADIRHPQTSPAVLPLRFAPHWTKKCLVSRIWRHRISGISHPMFCQCPCPKIWDSRWMAGKSP